MSSDAESSGDEKEVRRSRRREKSETTKKVDKLMKELESLKMERKPKKRPPTPHSPAGGSDTGTSQSDGEVVNRVTIRTVLAYEEVPRGEDDIVPGLSLIHI